MIKTLGVAKDCCKNPDNLVEKDRPKPDVQLFVCKICSCRHFIAKPDKFTLGARLQPLGSK